jgi:hypothetical protein
MRFIFCLAASAFLIPYAVAVAHIGEKVNRAAADFNKGIPYVRSHSTIAPFITDVTLPVNGDALGHAVALYALQRNGIYLGDTAAPLGYGVVRFRTGVNLVPFTQLWSDSCSLDLKRYASTIDYAVSWTDSAVGEPPGLREKYTEVFETTKLKVFERSDRTLKARSEK